MPPEQIRVIAICVFRQGKKILVCEYFEKSTDTPFYRPLGGAVEFGETSEAAIRREIKEEIGQKITDLKLLTILESIFVHEGRPHHEIVYVYEGRFADKSAYEQDSFEVHEETETLQASWKKLDFFNDYHRLVPEALIPLLKTKG